MNCRPMIIGRAATITVPAVAAVPELAGFDPFVDPEYESECEEDRPEHPFDRGDVKVADEIIIEDAFG